MDDTPTIEEIYGTWWHPSPWLEPLLVPSYGDKSGGITYYLPVGLALPVIYSL